MMWMWIYIIYSYSTIAIGEYVGRGDGESGKWGSPCGGRSLLSRGGRCSRLPSPPASASRSAPPAAAALARAGAIAAAFDSTLHVLARGVARGVLSPTRLASSPFM
uniref:Mitogen-activated protein kinase n=1 Tax=Oryza glumipatula TaxID=40148 RepID=A0A0E0ADW5_9ORYZ